MGEIGLVIKAVETVITIAQPIIVKAAPALQRSMKEFAERMLIISEKYPSIAEYAEMIDKAADVFGDVLFVLGIQTDPADVLGLKVSQAQKSAEDFDSAAGYIDYLRNEIELDKEKYENLSAEEKAVYSAVGMSVEAAAAGEKLGVEIPAEVAELIAQVAIAGKLIAGSEELVHIIRELKEAGIINLIDVYECIQGVGDSDRLKTMESLIKILDSLHPDKGNDILMDIIDEIRR